MCYVGGNRLVLGCRNAVFQDSIPRPDPSTGFRIRAARDPDRPEPDPSAPSSKVWKLGTYTIHNHGVEPICLHKCPLDPSRPRDGGAVWCVEALENGRLLTAGADRRVTRWS